MLHLLKNPAHLHLLLNHLPIIGLGVAALGLLLAMLARNRGAQIIALSLVALTAASAWPVYLTGENAYRSVRGIADEQGGDWLDVHLDRADRTINYFALPTVLALLALFVPGRFPRSAQPLNLATLLAACACLVLANYIAEAGGKIRHPELRQPSPLNQPSSHP